MPDAADAKPIDTGSHQLLDLADDRPDCPHCRGTGKVYRTADYLAEVVAMLPVGDPAQMDAVVADFYRALVGTETTKGIAPHLRQLFPADLTTGDALNSRGHRQRDQLLDALKAILTRYDPDHPGSEAMVSLLNNADTWGRTHAEWVRADGSLYVPSESDYLAVRSALVAVLAPLPDFGPEHADAITRAYRTVSLRMQVAADAWRMERGAPTVARRARDAK
jgi:hypothetical protein